MPARLSARDVSVVFKVEGFNGTAPRAGKRFFRDPATNDVAIRALDGVSLVAEPGDRIALIGPSGAGKTTLLRTLCGIFTPSRGEVVAQGQMRVMFRPGIAVDMHASGMDNIWLCGLFDGMSPAEIRAKIPDILDFCELGEFIHMPLKTYSAGMRMRLVYAIATASSPEILLLDEVIGVGDRKFIAKAAARRARFMESASILFMASHATGIIRQFCNRIVWLDAGRVVEDSYDIDAVLRRYEATGSLPAKASE